MNNFMNEDVEALEVKVLKISDRIKKALKISDEDIEEMLDSDKVVVVNKYKIVADSRCFSYEWYNILEILPIEFKSNSVGWANKKQPIFKSDWIYKMRGTMTINCPPMSVVNFIIEEIRNK